MYTIKWVSFSFTKKIILIKLFVSMQLLFKFLLSVPPASSSVAPVPGTFSWPLAPRGKPRRGMLRRAVFSDLQRKALERTFQKQKYISKPDRKKLASKLGLKDSQVHTKDYLPVCSILFISDSPIYSEQVQT